MTPDELRAAQSLGGRLGAYRRWSKVADRAAALAPARDGFLAKLEREVDPDGVMTPKQRAAAAEAARRAHMAFVAQRSRQVRQARKKRQAKGAAGADRADPPAGESPASESPSAS